MHACILKQVIEKNGEVFYCFMLMDQNVEKHISKPLLEIYKILYGNLPSHTLRMPHHALCDIILYANNTGACLHHMTMGGESNFVHWAREGVGQILQVCGMCCSMKCRTE